MSECDGRELIFFVHKLFVHRVGVSYIGSHPGFALRVPSLTGILTDLKLFKDILASSKHPVIGENYSMMTSSNRNFSALLSLCVGNSLVTGEFPAQRLVTQSFDVFFDLRPNKQLGKQSSAWFEPPSRWLWRHCNVIGLLQCEEAHENLFFSLGKSHQTRMPFSS